MSQTPVASERSLHRGVWGDLFHLCQSGKIGNEFIHLSYDIQILFTLVKRHNNRVQMTSFEILITHYNCQNSCIYNP